ncbi:MAG: putative membrane protein YphA (DoxX/SURF4 family) [Parvicellaceae bacterium]|jgi:uncharacterized membrane protein YphA (DoxX/SURF4 family)
MYFLQIINPTEIAIATVRIILGLLFFFQAYDKIFNVGQSEFTRTVMAGDKVKWMPKSFIQISTTLSSFIELIGGGLLILGIFLPFVYLFLAINLIMVGLAFSYMKPIWDMKHYFPRLAMLVYLMMMPAEIDVYAIQSLFYE